MHCLWVLAFAFLSPQDDFDTAQSYFDEGDLSSAIDWLSQRTDTHPEESRAWRWLGDAYYRLANEWLQSGSDPSFAFNDAKMAYQKALELAPMDRDALRGAYDICLAIREFELATAYAYTDLAMASLSQESSTEWFVERVARARLESFKARISEGDRPSSLELYELGALLRKAFKQAPSTSALAKYLGEYYQYLELPGPAAQAFENGLLKHPGDGELHQLLVNLTYAQDSVERLGELYKRFDGNELGNPTSVWYRGYGELLVGDVARRERRFQDALDHYEKSVGWLNQSAALEPYFRESADRISLLAQCGRAWCFFRQGDIERARREFQRLLRTYPEHRNLVDGLQRTIITGMSALGAALESRGLYAEGAEVARNVLEHDPESGYWWNNLGFFLREYGSQIETGLVPTTGDKKQLAMKVYRESWNSYLKATAFSPDDARFINDTALIQVYHLRDDLDAAHELLNRAIEAGTRQLQELGEEASLEDRYSSLQAVGDAYQNIAYIAYHLQSQPKVATEFFQKAYDIDPYGRAEVPSYLKSLREGLEPIEERPNVVFPPGRSPSRPAIDHAYERSLADAQSRAITENKPILAFISPGVSADAPLFESWIRSRQFAENAHRLVLVVADKNRGSSLDRRKDGTRLVNPDYGTITSGEHTSVHANLETLWNEGPLSADGHTLPEEGFLWLSPDGSRLDVPFDYSPRISIDVAVGQVGEPRKGTDLAGMEHALLQEQDYRERVASVELVSTHTSESRDLIEALVFSKGTRSVVRRGLIDAISQSQDPLDQELLSALAAQRVDRELALEAVRRWGSADPQPLYSAWHWSPWPEVRREAALSLARVDSETAAPLLSAMFLSLEDGFDQESALDALVEIGPSGHDVIFDMLGFIRNEAHRARLCFALRGSGNTQILNALQDYSESDPSLLVRAAATRSLQEKAPNR